LDHSWVKKMVPKAGDALLSELMLSNMCAFSPHSMLKKAALQLVAGQLGEDARSSFREVFNGLDVHGVGFLTLGDLQAGLAKSGLKAESVSLELAQVVNGMDVNGNGQVEYTEFVAAALDEEHYSKEAVLREVFYTLDTNRDGVISEGELNAVLGDVCNSDAGVTLSMRGRMAEAGLGDGTGGFELDFKAFAAMMRARPKVSETSPFHEKAASNTSTGELLPNEASMLTNEASMLSEDFTEDFDDCAGDSGGKSLAWAKRVASELPVSGNRSICPADVVFELDGEIAQ